MGSTSWADDVPDDAADKPDTAGSASSASSVSGSSGASGASSASGPSGTGGRTIPSQYDRPRPAPLTARERHASGTCEPCYYYFMHHTRNTRCTKGSECSHCHDRSHWDQPDRLQAMVERFEQRHQYPGAGGRPSSGPSPHAGRTGPPRPQPLGSATSSSHTSLASSGSEEWPAIGGKTTSNTGGADAAAGAWAQRARGAPAPSTDSSASTTAPSTPAAAEPASAAAASPPPATQPSSGTAAAAKTDDGRAATPPLPSTAAAAGSSTATAGSVRPRLSTPVTADALAGASASPSAVNLVTPAAAQALGSTGAATMTLANVPGIDMGNAGLSESPQSSGTPTATSDAGTDSGYGPTTMPALAAGAAVGVRPRPPPPPVIPDGGYSPAQAAPPPRRRPYYGNSSSYSGPGVPGRFPAGPPPPPVAVPMAPGVVPGIGAPLMYTPPTVAVMPTHPPPPPPPGPVPEFLITCQECGHARAAVLVSYCGHRLCERCFAQTNFRVCGKSDCQNMKRLQGSFVALRVYF